MFTYYFFDLVLFKDLTLFIATEREIVKTFYDFFRLTMLSFEKRNKNFPRRWTYPSVTRLLLTTTNQVAVPSPNHRSDHLARQTSENKRLARGEMCPHFPPVRKLLPELERIINLLSSNRDPILKVAPGMFYCNSCKCIPAIYSLHLLKFKANF